MKDKGQSTRDEGTGDKRRRNRGQQTKEYGTKEEGTGDKRRRNRGQETKEQGTRDERTGDKRRRHRGQETKEQETRDEGTGDRKQRNKGQEQWNRATEKGTLGQLIGVRGRRTEDGIQTTDHVRQKVRVQRTGDKEQVMRQGIEDRI
jgi:hypothetical protein